MTAVQDPPVEAQPETPAEIVEAEANVNRAKEAEKAIKEQLTAAKAEARKAATAVKTAQKGEDGKAGDELKAAKAATKDAKEAEKVANANVKDLETRAAEAKAAIGTARDAVKTVKDAHREAEKARRAEERANRPKLPGMTLSQRRALLRLADGPMRPATSMNRTPLDYLLSLGYAETADVTVQVPVEKPNPKADEDGQPKTITENEDRTIVEYRITESGAKRAGTVNDKWLTWSPAKTDAAADAVPADEDGTTEPTEPTEEPATA